jgi:ABC-2 type transport system permease protein
VIIADPERDFLPGETAALDAYLKKGGALMVFTGAGAGRLPELEALLASWGLFLLPGFVREPVAHNAGNPASLIPMYGMHRINMDFAERRYYLAMPDARPVGLAEDLPGLITTRLLLSTGDSYAQTQGEGAASPSRTDSRGPFALAGLTERADGNPALVLFGSAGICAGDLMASSAYANREYLVRSALVLAGRGGPAFVIPPKTLASPAINAGLGLTLAVVFVFVILLPLTALAAGLVRVLGRRRR